MLPFLILGQFGQADAPGSRCPLIPLASPDAGWSDELNSIHRWDQASPGHPATVSVPKPGAMELRLGSVPAGWPYAYQWSGVTRDATVDVGRFPILSAEVARVHGYAHLEVEALDANDKPFKSFRGTTLQNPGVSTCDLRSGLDPAIYRLRIRLIVGGPNEGCSATYHWVRFTAPQSETGTLR